LQPSEGKPRPVGEAIVELLFPEQEQGRIPIAVVAGAGTSATARLLSQLLRAIHSHVGLASSDGVFVNGRTVDSHQLTPQQATHDVMINPNVEAAVVQVSHDSIVQEGLPVEDCHVAVLGDLPDSTAQVLIDAVVEEGALVLDADEPRAGNLARTNPEQAILCSPRSEHPLLIEHRARGGRIAFLDDDTIVLAEGSSEVRLALPNADSAGRVLLAASAAWALGLAADALEQTLWDKISPAGAGRAPAGLV
jgi:cyanophycin synthetase